MHLLHTKYVKNIVENITLCLHDRYYIKGKISQVLQKIENYQKLWYGYTLKYSLKNVM